MMPFSSTLLGVEPILHAGGKIFGAVRWRSVDDASTRVHGDVIRQHAKDFAIEKRMLKVQALHFVAGEAGQLTHIR